MKKIMILGASILQLPAIIKAKEKGLQVIAVDMDKNAIGFQYADICLEISTIDTEKILEAARFYNIDGIITVASDIPMRTVAKISNELGLEDNIKELIWLIMFIVCMVLVFISLKISKNIKKGERVLGVIVLILLIGYIIYFCLG